MVPPADLHCTTWYDLTSLASSFVTSTQLSVEKAVDALRGALAGAATRYGHYASGIVRWQVPLPRGDTALQWLQVWPQVWNVKRAVCSAHEHLGL